MYRKWPRAAVVVVVLILAVAVSGVALAGSDPQAKPDKTMFYQDFLAKFAANLGVDREKVEAALKETHKQMLDEAVKDGRLTQEQADKMAARAGEGPLMFGGFHGKIHDKKFGFRGPGRKFNDDMAKALGITPEQLKEELESGKKLPQIITDRGMTAEEFHKKLLEIKKENLAKSVSEGKITQDQADKMIEKMEQRMNNTAPRPGN